MLTRVGYAALNTTGLYIRTHLEPVLDQDNAVIYGIPYQEPAKKAEQVNRLPAPRYEIYMVLRMWFMRKCQVSSSQFF